MSILTDKNVEEMVCKIQGIFPFNCYRTALKLNNSGIETEAPRKKGKKTRIAHYRTNSQTGHHNLEP